ncbi:recombinase family protein (plasmid) [Azospirillum argentinense]|uniref:Recombinase family protein n=1 Tax=Azospirillum argentinense TaxID=2970906 RepID=A0A4D8PZN7_9PROT|nr:recombinase family protein [Azospirillum argentinense]QCO00040.1 recombinase family protein [Azospirillum argentinense]
MALVAYARVSTEEQSTDSQILALKQAGCSVIFEEHASGGDRDRPVLAKALASLKRGDTLVVARIDRLARSLFHLLEVIDGLRQRGIAFKSLGDPIDTTSPQGRFALQVLGAAAELERALIRERSIAGLRAAVAKGKEPGNPGLRRRDPAALEKVRQGRETARDELVVAHAQEFLPTVEALRPTAPWDQVVRALKGQGRTRPWDRKPWTPNSLIRAVRRLAAVGLVRQDVLDPAPKRVDSDDLVLMVAGLARAEPGITLDGIALRLRGMGQRTPRGGLRWSRSSVKNLLDRAKELGLVRDAGAV